MKKTTVPICTQEKIPTKNRKLFKSVVDLGNHWTKMYIDGYDWVREPSWMSKCSSNASDKLPGHVSYIDGVRDDLKNTCWLIGHQAVRAGASDLIRLVDEYTGKSSLWLEYYLGILSHLPQINAQMDIDVTTTCNDVVRHEKGIKANEGLHTVELRGIPCKVNIKIKAVLPEGIAALKSKSLEGAVTICDIGGGNVSISRFYNSEPNGNVIVKDFGAEYLIEKIASNSNIKGLIKQAPSRYVINRSLEVGIKFKKSESGEKIAVLNYGESDINFYKIYAFELQDFITCRLREVIKQLEQYQLAGDKVLVIGGGSKLPLLAAALKKKGFLISDNGSFDNLSGLVKELA
jgi:hypothetical protein